MHVTLDAQTEQRIQREIDRGHYHTPSEVITRALDLLQADEDFLTDHRDEINAHLTLSLAQAEQGVTRSPEEARQILAKRRAARNIPYQV